MDLSGVFSIVALVVAILLLLPLIVGGVFVVVVVANRADPDPSGRRPALVYALGTAFLTLFVTLFATTSFVAALCRLIGSHRVQGAFASSFITSGGHEHPLGDSVARVSVLSAIVAIIAGVVCWLHLRAAGRASSEVSAIDPVARVQSSYVAAVCFLSVLIAVFASIVVIYDVFRGIAPGVFSSSGDASSVAVLRSMIPALYLALASLAILVAHLRFAPPPFRPGVFGRWYGGSSPAPAAEPAPITTPPPAATTQVLEARRAPRKRSPRKPPGDG